MSYKIVVARYNEDVHWLGSEIQNCIIYNKGDKLNIRNIGNEIILENVGRESETYLNYIIHNYTNLPDVVVFTQAKISDHRGRNDVNYLIQMKNEALNHSRSRETVVHYEHGRCCWNSEWNLENGIYFLEDNYKNNKPVKFIDWFKRCIKAEYPNPIRIYSNGIFAVRKENILKHPVEYYKQLILEVNHHVNSSEGHFFERSWYYIFS